MTPGRTTFPSLPTPTQTTARTNRPYRNRFVYLLVALGVLGILAFVLSGWEDPTLRQVAFAAFALLAVASYCWLRWELGKEIDEAHGRSQED